MSTPNVEFRGITPYLHYDDVPRMIEWLTRVFGFSEKGRWLDAQGAVQNAELVVGSNRSVAGWRSAVVEGEGSAPGRMDWSLGRQCGRHVRARENV